jgi:hypothetical protein
MGRFISEDTYEGDLLNPLSLNLYSYVENNPLKYTDPSGNMPVWALNEISDFYSSTTLADWEASLLVFFTNGLSSGKHASFYTPFHEIAQINVAKHLNELDTGINVELERKLGTGEFYSAFGIKLVEKSYEADIVMGDEVWEVKPIKGKDPKAQLEKYRIIGGLTPSDRLVGETIDNITVFDELKMRLTFPKAGEVRYEMYLDHGNGTTEALTTVAAAKYLLKLVPKIVTRGKGFEPLQ